MPFMRFDCSKPTGANPGDVSIPGTSPCQPTLPRLEGSDGGGMPGLAEPCPEMFQLMPELEPWPSPWEAPRALRILCFRSVMSWLIFAIAAPALTSPCAAAVMKYCLAFSRSDSDGSYTTSSEVSRVEADFADEAGPCPRP